MSLRLDCLTSEAAIERVLPEWRELWDRMPHAMPFQSPEWLLPWWRCFGTDAPAVLTARSLGRLVGVLPLYLRREPECCKLLPIGISLSDYLDALVDRNVSGVADALLAASAAIPEWDECYLPALPHGAALLDAGTPPGVSEMRHQDEVCPMLRLPAALPRNKRHNLRRERRAMERTGAAHVELAGEGEIAAAMDDLFRLHEKRWRERGATGVCAGEPVQRFHRAAATGLATAGLLRLYRLHLDGVVIAALYGFAANGTAYAYLCGFDPDYASLGAGTQLLAHAIEEATREKAREFHFLRGDEAHKQSWGAVSRPTFARCLMRGSSRTC